LKLRLRPRIEERSPWSNQSVQRAGALNLASDDASTRAPAWHGLDLKNAVLHLKRSLAVVVVPRRHHDHEIEFRNDADRLPASTQRADPMDITPIEPGATKPPQVSIALTVHGFEAANRDSLARHHSVDGMEFLPEAEGPSLVGRREARVDLAGRR